MRVVVLLAAVAQPLDVDVFTARAGVVAGAEAAVGVAKAEGVGWEVELVVAAGGGGVVGAHSEPTPAELETLSEVAGCLVASRYVRLGDGSECKVSELLKRVCCQEARCKRIRSRRRRKKRTKGDRLLIPRPGEKEASSPQLPRNVKRRWKCRPASPRDKHPRRLRK